MKRACCAFAGYRPHRLPYGNDESHPDCIRLKHRLMNVINWHLEQQIVDYYSTTHRYIRSGQHSNAHQTVFVKEHDRYQWLVLEQKSQSQVEVRQTDRHGKITAWDNYELARNLPKCVGVGRLCEDGNMQIHFNADKINLIYQFGEQGKAETCKFIRNPATYKGWLHQADSEHHFGEIKFLVRRKLYGIDRHHYKAETYRA